MAKVLPGVRVRLFIRLASPLLLIRPFKLRMSNLLENPRRSQPVKAVVPHSKPELVYDIKYFTRERRRAEEKALFGADSVKVRAAFLHRR